MFDELPNDGIERRGEERAHERSRIRAGKATVPPCGSARSNDLFAPPGAASHESLLNSGVRAALAARTLFLHFLYGCNYST